MCDIMEVDIPEFKVYHLALGLLFLATSTFTFNGILAVVVSNVFDSVAPRVRSLEY